MVNHCDKVDKSKKHYKGYKATLKLATSIVSLDQEIKTRWEPQMSLVLQ